MKTMTKAEAVQQFRADNPRLCPGKGHKCPDTLMRDQLWSDWADGLIQDGTLPKSAYNWSHPFN